MNDLNKDLKSVLNTSFGKPEEQVLFELESMLRERWIRTLPEQVLNEMDVIVSLVANEAGLPVDIIKSRSQQDDPCMARSMCYNLMVRMGYGMNTIAEYFCRHHATILSALRARKNDLKTNRAFYLLSVECDKAYEKIWPVIAPNRFVGKYEAMFRE